MSSHWQGTYLDAKSGSHRHARPLKMFARPVCVDLVTWIFGVAKYTVGRSGICCKCCWQLICEREVQVQQLASCFHQAVLRYQNEQITSLAIFIFSSGFSWHCVSHQCFRIGGGKKSNDAAIPHAVPLDYVLPSGWSKDVEKPSQSAPISFLQVSRLTILKVKPLDRLLACVTYG